MRIYDLYGSREHGQERLRNAVSRKLDIEFRARSSGYKGDYYLAHGESGERITITSNKIEDEDGIFLQEPEFPEFRTLLVAVQKISSPTELPTVLDKIHIKLQELNGISFLKRTTPRIKSLLDFRCLAPHLAAPKYRNTIPHGIIGGSGQCRGL